ncbi:MAG: polymer-forming cytoskeletal protein [Balneolales bacterium]|nr:polymer-forming cytoskeletal protein [Balneolales bacterium]
MIEKKANTPDLEYVCFLGKDSLIHENTLIASSHLKITGSVSIDVHCLGNLVVSQAGLVFGDIVAENVHVYGKVKGDIWANNNVHLYKGAQVIGKINSDFLKVEEGTSCRIDATVGDHVRSKTQNLLKQIEENYKRIQKDMLEGFTVEEEDEERLSRLSTNKKSQIASESNGKSRNHSENNSSSTNGNSNGNSRGNTTRQAEFMKKNKSKPLFF